MIASEQTLGTKDNVAVPIITNNQERTRITADGRIGIGTNALNRSALVEMASTSKGLLPPRMTSSEHDAITNPAKGLLVYVNTPSEEGYWCFDGTCWLPFISTASSNSTIVTRYESSDESVINSSVLQDDDHLFVTLGANQVWEIEGMLEFSSTSAKPGVMFGLALPSGANFKFRYHSNEGSATGFRARVFASDTASITIPANGSVILFARSVIVMGGSNGTVCFQWVQNTADATPTISRGSSYMKFT